MGVTLSLVALQIPYAIADSDPFPGIASGAEIPGTRISSAPGDSQAQWEATDAYKNRPACSAGAGNALEVNATTHIYSIYCVKTWRPTEDVNADANFRAAQDAAIAVATAASQAWNAANPGKQKCVQWGPIVHANGVSTASGGVCANPVDPGPGTSVPTAAAPPTVATTPNPTPTTTPPTVYPPVAPDANPDLAVLGNGKPFTRVLPGQLSTTECPVGFQGANGVIVAIGTGTFTECWPENAWAAWRLGGSVWEEFKASGGTTDVLAEVARRANVAEVRVQAKLTAQIAADETPGVQRCSTWSGYGETGDECAYTFITPGAVNGSIGVEPSSDTTTATISQTDPAKATSENKAGAASPTSLVVEVTASLADLPYKINDVLPKGIENSAMSTIVKQLTNMKSTARSKTVALPTSRTLEEVAISLTPKVCTIVRTLVKSLSLGICIFSFKVTGDSGNSFTTQKTVQFKK